MRFRYYSLGISFVFILFASSHGLAGDAAKLIPPVPQVEDNPSPPPEVAREIADIQRQLGGSIVRSPGIFSQPQPAQPSMPTLRYPSRHPGWNMVPPPFQVAPSPISARSPAEQKVELLRAAASQLDVTASRLESADLYLQADKLRDTAHGFRLEARELRGQTPSTPVPPAPLP